MSREVILPQLGQSVESCIILEWKKHEGDYIKKGEVICEVETDKSTLEVESTEEGTLLKLLYAEGDLVPVLSPIAIVGEEGEMVEHLKDNLKDNLKAISKGIEKEPKRIGISPRARLLAEKRGIDITGIIGTGPGGRIIERDVLKVLSEKEPSGKHPGRAATESKVEEVLIEEKPSVSVEPSGLSGIRRVIAERMLHSLRNSAQYTIHGYADASGLISYRKKLKLLEKSGGGSDGKWKSFSQISIGDLVDFALVRTLTDFPEINSTVDNGKLTSHRNVNLGFAVDTKRGLIVPVIKDADKLSLLELSRRTRELALSAREGRVKPEELTGATFTVTNLGNMGIDFFTPVINPPQVAILGVNSIRPRAVYAEELGGEVKFIPAIGLSLTADHRFIDGAPAARFLSALAETVKRIEIILAGG